MEGLNAALESCSSVIVISSYTTNNLYRVILNRFKQTKHSETLLSK